MTSLDKYLEIIKKGFSERENLMAMEPLHSIEEIASLLDEKLTYKEFIDINRLLRQKYIVENPEDMLKDVDFNQLSLPSNTRVIYLMGSKSDVLDFSIYEQVEKILFAELDESEKDLEARDFFNRILKIEKSAKAFYYAEVIFLIIDTLFILFGGYKKL